MARRSIGTAMNSPFEMVSKARTLKETAFNQSIIQIDAMRSRVSTCLAQTRERFGNLRSTVVLQGPVKDISLVLFERTEAILESVWPLPDHVRITCEDHHGMNRNYDGDEDEFDSPSQSIPRSVLVPLLPTFVVKLSRFATLKVTVLSKPERLCLQDFVRPLRPVRTTDFSVAVVGAARILQRFLGDERVLRLFGQVKGSSTSISQRNISPGDVVFDLVEASDASLLAHQKSHVQGVEPALRTEFHLIIKNSFIEFAEDSLCQTSQWRRRSQSWSHSLDQMNMRIGCGEPFTLPMDCLNARTEGTVEHLVSERGIPTCESNAHNNANINLDIGVSTTAGSPTQSTADSYVLGNADGNSSVDTNSNTDSNSNVGSYPDWHAECHSDGHTDSHITVAPRHAADWSVCHSADWSESTSCGIAGDPGSCSVRVNGDGNNNSKRIESTGGASESRSTETRTTVMLRNIPSGCTRAQLLELLDSSGFSSRYDFAYLPMDFTHGVGLGYAFVNMVTSEDALRLQRCFTGFKDWIAPSDCVCEASWSNVRQGLDQHIARYRNSPVLHPSVCDEYKPISFKNGERVAFPPPTTTIRPPRIRHTRG